MHPCPSRALSRNLSLLWPCWDSVRGTCHLEWSAPGCSQGFARAVSHLLALMSFFILLLQSLISQLLVFWAPCWCCSRCNCLLLWFILFPLLTFQDCFISLEEKDILLAMGPLWLMMWSEYRGSCLEYETICAWRRGSVPESFLLLFL